MKSFVQDPTGFEIAGAATCDFDTLQRIDNNALFRDVLQRDPAPRLLEFIGNTMGAQIRYHAHDDQDAIDLARQALTNLIARHPEVLAEADFLIFAGISNPRPVTTVAALLADEFRLGNVGCWDLKSGCSGGILAMLHAHGHMMHGARGGIIVCAETLSKFTNPKALQMAVSTGDGAAAIWVRRSDSWRFTGVVHGTDARFSRAITLKGRFPVDFATYDVADYCFSLDQKPEGVEELGRRWHSSLKDLLEVSATDAKTVTGYIAHQVDAAKNAQVPAAFAIPDNSVAKCFARYGNMGCPTVFINYAEWIGQRHGTVGPGDTLIFHAVGGGLSWAGVTLSVS